MHLDLAFQIQSQSPIPADHGYPLFSAVSRLLPEIHRENGIGIHPIRGKQIGNRQMMLTDRSRLTIRVSDGKIAPLLKLAGKALRLGEEQIRVGVPQVRALIPATTLRSRLVTIKVKDTPAEILNETNFTAALRKQLNALGVSEQVQIHVPLHLDNNKPRRRALHMKGKKIIGYEVVLEGLSAEESLAVQEQGLGGRRHMGCGIFVPMKSKGGTK